MPRRTSGTCQMTTMQAEDGARDERQVAFLQTREGEAAPPEFFLHRSVEGIDKPDSEHQQHRRH